MKRGTMFGSTRGRLLAGLVSAAAVATLVLAPALGDTVVELTSSEIEVVGAAAQDGAITVVSNDGTPSLRDAGAIESWEALQQAIDDAPDGTPVTITLTRHLGGGSELVIPAGKDITIELAGYTLAQQGDGQRVITNNGTLTIRGDDGRGSRIEGSQVANVDGAGIYSTEGSVLTIEDCTITHCKADGRGGAVCSAGTLTMNRVTVQDNTVKDLDVHNGGGICIEKSGSAVLNDCEISNNGHSEWPSKGGGIYCEGDLTINGGDIHDNFAVNGGGVYVSNGGSLALAGCTMSKNEAFSKGGGVYLAEGASLSMNDGSITENHAREGGGGIYLENAGAVSMEGASVVKGNTLSSGVDSNMQLSKDVTLAVGTLVDGADVGVSMGDGSATGAFTSGFGQNNPDASPRNYFHADDERCVIYPELIDGEACLAGKMTSWANLNKFLNEAGGLEVGYLEEDLTATSDDDPLTVPEGRTFKLDMQGHTIDRGLSEWVDHGGVIENSGALTLVNGTVTGGKTTGDGGGITNGQGATLSLEGVTVEGNSAQQYGGGIDNSGTMILGDRTSVRGNTARCGGGINSLYEMTAWNGVTIEANAATERGGGIKNMGDLTLDDAVVRNNSSEGDGGGIHNMGTKLELFGGTEVTNNTAGTESADGIGGGLYNDSSWVSVGDSARVTGNTASKGGNDVYLCYDRSINVVRSLTDEAQFGVTLANGTGRLTVGYDRYNGGQSPDGFFKADEGLNVSLMDDGEVEISKYTQGLATFSYNVALGDSIDIVFNVRDLTDDPENYTIEYGPTGGEMQVTRLSDPELNTFTIASCSAKEMGDTFDVIVMHNTSPNDGEVIKESQYSVRGYCRSVISRDGKVNQSMTDEQAAALCDLCKATLDYGSHTQRVLGYRTYDLANGGRDYFDNAAIVVPLVDRSVSGSCEGITGQNISLVTTSKTQFAVLFKHKKGADKADYTFTVDGEPYANDKVIDRNNKFEVWIDGIVAKDLAKEHTITVSKGESTYTYTASPVCYLSRAIYGDAPVEKPEVFRALYNYYEKAVDYFSTVGRA